MLRPASVGSTRVRLRFARAALALSLVASMGAATLARDEVRAQDSILLSISSITPAEVAVYAEIKLDPENVELQELDQLLLRLGSDESLIESIEQSAEEATGGVDVTNAEVAFVLLPSGLENAAGTTAPDLDDLIDPDSVASEFEEAGAGVSDEGVALVIRPEDIAELEASAAEEAGADIETEDYLGHEVVSYSEDDGDSAAYVVIDDFLVYATTVDDAKLFVDASLDGGETLAGVEEFAAASDALPAERVAFAYTNGEVVVDAIEQMDDPTVAPIVNEVFADYRAHIGATLGAEDDGVSFESVMIPADGSTVEPRGTADGLNYAEQMPADTVAFASGHDLGETMVVRSLGIAMVAGFGAALPGDSDDVEATPVPMTVEDMYDSVALFLGFNLKTDFMDQLTGPYAFGVWGVDAEDPTTIDAVVVSGAGDSIVLGDTIDSISFLIQAGGQGEVSVVSRTVGDATVNNVTFDADGSTMSVDFGLIDDQFVLGLGDGVDTLMLGPDGSLAESPRYLAALDHLPSEYESIQYFDIAALAELSESAGTEDMMGDVIASPVAGPVGDVQPDSYASVSYVEDGYTRTSAIIVFP